jgi:hypothetical protein
MSANEVPQNPQDSFSDIYGDVESNEVFKLLTEGSMLPEGFRDIQIWRDLSEAIDEVFGSNIAALIKDLYGMQEIGYATRKPSIDKATLLRRTKALGVTTDLNVLDLQDVRNFVRYAPEFWKEKGGRNFIQYMSFVVNAVLEMSYSWTNNYQVFQKEGSDAIGTPVYEGGDWYPTSHVLISYDVSKFRNSVITSYSDQETLSRFFYSIAPINLVIQTFLLAIPMQGTFTTSMAIQMKVYQHTNR